MMYTVRYTEAGDMQHVESVEANSPSEAMIKFRAVHPGFASGVQGQVVTSVSSEVPVESFSGEDM